MVRQTDSRQAKIGKLSELARLPRHIFCDGKNMLDVYVSVTNESVLIRYCINWKRQCGELECRTLDDAIAQMTKIRAEMQE